MNKQDWFYDRKWGMFNHYIGYSPKGDIRAGWKEYKDYNEKINRFDVDQYAKIAHEVNAGYVFFTIMQGDRFMCAPNDTFNQITGYKPGEACSERDLIADLIKALDKYNIPLFLYFTGDGPYIDEYAGRKFNYHNREKELVNPEFIEKWTAVLKEYAVRYGEKVHGWWLDGTFDYLGYVDHDDDYLKPYADAIKAGNPDALIAFNNGVLKLDFNNPMYEKYYDGEKHPLSRIRKLEKYALEGDETAKNFFGKVAGINTRYSKHENYTAGETNEFTEYPKGRFVDGLQWHILSFLGANENYNKLWGNCAWNSMGCKYSAEYMYHYVKKCNELGGVVSIDTFLYDDGHIDWGQYEILKKLGELRKRNEVTK